MPFPWLHPVRTPPHGRAAMYRHELEERAALLHRLGYSRERTRARLAQNVAWDFEIGAGPGPAPAEIDAVVEAVFRRGGTGSGPPSV